MMACSLVGGYQRFGGTEPLVRTGTYGRMILILKWMLKKKGMWVEDDSTGSE
jgi:hypothetical protein